MSITSKSSIGTGVSQENLDVPSMIIIYSSGKKPTYRVKQTRHDQAALMIELEGMGETEDSATRSGANSWTKLRRNSAMSCWSQRCEEALGIGD